MKKLTKEDIKKYGTPKEIKLLEVKRLDPWPLDDDDEDEQEAGEKPYGIGEPVTVPRELLDDILGALTNTDESDEVNNLISKLGDILGYDFRNKENDDEDVNEHLRQTYPELDDEKVTP